jgi:hypothetical protein
MIRKAINFVGISLLFSLVIFGLIAFGSVVIYSTIP